MPRTWRSAGEREGARGHPRWEIYIDGDEMRGRVKVPVTIAQNLRGHRASGMLQGCALVGVAAVF